MDEWRRWMPEALAPRPLESTSASSLLVRFDHGALRLAWQVLPPRDIALLRLPRLRVSFQFEDVQAEVRQAFMARLDLHLRRGGG